MVMLGNGTECKIHILKIPCMKFTNPRKAKESLVVAKIDKTIIIEDSLGFGTDTMDTLEYPQMESLAEQFDVDESPLPEPPTSELVTYIELSFVQFFSKHGFSKVTGTNKYQYPLQKMNPI